MAGRCLDVMIVEDERLISMMLSRIIQKLGHRVCACAASAKEALDTLERVTPDLVFLDINLEGPADGISVGETLAGERSVPFVYATAYTDAETKARAARSKPMAFLAKPVDMATVKTLCDALSGSASAPGSGSQARDAPSPGSSRP